MILCYVFREEVMSIEATNKLRASLGLAPLETEEASTSSNNTKDDPILKESEKLFTEDGVKIVHSKPNNWSKEKSTSKQIEKLETQKQKRQIESKVLKTRKTLAESSDDDEDATTAWIDRNRRLEEERKKAELKVCGNF